MYLLGDRASQKVPFPRFHLRLEAGQSLEDFILKVEEKASDMVGEFILNEYKAYKHIVKHNRRLNRVFLELGAETTLCPRPLGPDKKTQPVGAASFSAAVAPPMPRKKRASRREKSKDIAGHVSSPFVCPLKTKSLESVLTPKFGKESDLWVHLGGESVWWKERFS
jgi:DNA-directed RNA polymerase subunit N (RpoN/RPB10)